MIFLAAIVAANTGEPDTTFPASITMNGFFSITSSASARCAASSGPVAVTNS